MKATPASRPSSKARRLSLAPPPTEHALDVLLLRLRVHGFDYRPDPLDVCQWTATCVLCRRPNALIMRESEGRRRLTLRCSSGCDPDKVVGYLKREPSDVILAQRDVWIDELRELARESIALARLLAKQVAVLENAIGRALDGASNG